jgi:hypothetical protein
MKCKNTECQNEVQPKRTYCSLTCRNVYVNKHLRSYDKFKLTYKQRRDTKIEQYLLNPTKCKNCNSVLEYDKKDNQYCNASCNMKVNNPVFTETEQQRKEINLKISNKVKELLIKQGIAVGPFTLICKQCETPFVHEHKTIKFCSDKCRSENRKKDLSAIQRYRSLAHFKFALKDYPNEFDFSLIEKYGWYKAKNRGDNLNGISRDHKYSIDEGFKNNVDPLLLAHPANCRLVRHNDNVSKGGKSIITLEQLLNDIKEFDERIKKCCG